MDKGLSDRDMNLVVNAQKRATEMKLKMETKEDEKRWSLIHLPLTFREGLSRLTKSELSAVRSNLDVKGASSLKKQDLIDVLSQQMPIMLPNVLNKLDETRYRVLKQVTDQGGLGQGQNLVAQEPHQFDYFKQRGLLFTGVVEGQRTLVVPEEVLEVFKAIDDASYRQVIRRNTEWVKLTQGMLYYYGTLGLSQIVDILEQHTGVDLPLGEYLSVLDDSIAYSEEIRHDAIGFSHHRVFDPSHVKQEHEVRGELSFYPFTKTQLLRAGEVGFVERNSRYLSFVDFITKTYDITRPAADNLVEQCVYAIQNGETPITILQFFQYHFEIDDRDLIEAFMERISMLHNDTRQWFIKGHTPNELSRTNNRSRVPAFRGKAEVVHMATKKKVGRNDPCPCGSGTKFKKCCGR